MSNSEYKQPNGSEITDTTVTVIETPSRPYSTPAKKQKNVIEVGPKKQKPKRRVADLKCAEVRWFYQRPGETKWNSFKGYDSTVLEVAYRRKKGLELDEPVKGMLSSLPSDVIALDGNYIADENLENIKAIYWGEDTMQIRRGTWFYAEKTELSPLPGDFADAIEAHHLHIFKNNVIPETPVFSDSESSKKPVLTTIKWGVEEVQWNSIIDVHIAAEYDSPLIRFFTRSKGNIPLRRGYNEESDFSEGKPIFSDLILVVHGIGQKGYENLIAKNTAQIRDAIQEILVKNYPGEKRRPAILPIEWRSSLNLDNGLTDVVTLQRMARARSTLNSVCMDLMYYQSPLYRTDIVNGVIRCLNSVYNTFIANNPEFNGPVSIIGHSLGSVITYDILTNWSPFLLYDHFVTSAIEENLAKVNEVEQKRLLEDFHQSRKRLLDLEGMMEQILIRQEERLKFKVKYLFCIGSPLAVFLIMRGADYRTVIPHSGQPDRIFNIFHPYDPVAYRLEPIFHENYAHIRPLKLLNFSDAIKDYESMVYECGKKYLHKNNEIKKKEKKDAKTKNKIGKNSEKNTGNNSNNANAKQPSTAPSPIPSNQGTAYDEEDENEQGHFADDTDSDFEVQIEHTQDGQSRPESSRRVTPPTITATAANTPSTPSVSAARPLQNADELEKTEQATEAREDGAADCEDFPPASEDERQGKMTPLDELKQMGEAKDLIEQIPPERRIPRRIDFQVQPGGLLDKSYWSMIRSHFSYWSNMDFAAFLLNSIYPPPLEVPGLIKQ